MPAQGFYLDGFNQRQYAIRCFHISFATKAQSKVRGELESISEALCGPIVN
jgi:hypothetical protein